MFHHKETRSDVKNVCCVQPMDNKVQHLTMLWNDSAYFLGGCRDDTIFTLADLGFVPFANEPYHQWKLSLW